MNILCVLILLLFPKTEVKQTLSRENDQFKITTEGYVDNIITFGSVDFVKSAMDIDSVKQVHYNDACQFINEFVKIKSKSKKR
jgi:hypothetical protein